MTHEILLIEDDRPIRQLFERLLSRLGYAVIEATNGSEALDYLANHEPALVMVDLTLPGTASGVDVLRYIESTPRLKNSIVVVISAHPKLPSEIYHNRVARVITKPVRPTEITHIVQNLLKETISDLP